VPGGGRTPLRKAYRQAKSSTLARNQRGRAHEPARNALRRLNHWHFLPRLRSRDSSTLRTPVSSETRPRNGGTFRPRRNRCPLRGVTMASPGGKVSSAPVAVEPSRGIGAPDPEPPVPPTGENEMTLTAVCTGVLWPKLSVMVTVAT